MPIVRFLLVFPALLASLATRPGLADIAENRARLRSMPAEIRRSLHENLLRFDRLDSRERDALGRLDDRIADLPATDRERYLTLLLRYHAWLLSLDDEQRHALDEATPDRRLELVKQFREEQRAAKDKGRLSNSIWNRSMAFNPDSLSGEAHAIRCWQALKATERREFEQKISPLPPGRWSPLLFEMGRSRGVRGDLKHIRTQLDAERKKWLTQVERDETDPSKKARGRPFDQRSAINRLEAEYFRTHDLPPVDPSDLLALEADIPPWIRERISRFPPDAARWRLTALYHLVHETRLANATHGSTVIEPSRSAFDEVKPVRKVPSLPKPDPLPPRNPRPSATKPQPKTPRVPLRRMFPVDVPGSPRPS